MRIPQRSSESQTAGEPSRDTVETQYNKLENSFPAENAVSAVVQSEVETMFKKCQP